MELLEAIDVVGPDGAGRLELLQGNLAETPDEFGSDVLVVSAFPDDYMPTPKSLIGALYKKGLDVGSLAASKAYDLRRDFSCWLSNEIAPRIGLPYRRVLCFESADRGRAPDIVDDIFRALEPFALGPPYVSSVSLPFVASGDQGYDFDAMAKALLDAACHRLRVGHPIRRIRIVGLQKSAVERVSVCLNQHRKSLVSSDKAGSPIDANVFISYSRKDLHAARAAREVLLKRGVSVFLDEQNIKPGANWQSAIFEAIESCKCFLAIYSPDFVASRVCKDEFSASMIIRRRTHDGFIFPILVRSTQLPVYMEMLNYVDCCTSDATKIKAAGNALADRLLRVP